ncbi:MAG: GNAT family N-acetyltransferase [Chloroflexi bacterium]|nr:GNAT family N-acetyltransferase [Chloroflexota bacterium]
MLNTLPEGFVARPVKMDDLKAVVTLCNACSMKEIGKRVLEENELKTEWNMPTLNLETDTQVVLTPGGEFVGHVVTWDCAPHVRFRANVYVHPEYKGRLIGTYLRQWADERARQSIAKAPKGARVVSRCNTNSTNTAAQELLRQYGYQIVRHFFNMVIELDSPPPEPVVPEGILIRPFVRERETHALVTAGREAFKDHWDFIETPYEEELAEWETWMDGPTFDESLWFVAMDGDEMVGFSLCLGIVAEGPNVGHVAELVVRRAWRRRGIALAMLQHSFGELYGRGKTVVTLGVDGQSLTGATALYEQAGMRVRHRAICFEKELRPGKDLSTQSVQE